MSHTTSRTQHVRACMGAILAGTVLYVKPAFLAADKMLKKYICTALNYLIYLKGVSRMHFLNGFFMVILKTKRLTLRPWQEKDLEPFAQLNADPRVMEYFLGLKSRQESDQAVKLASEHIDRFGWGFWAASLTQTGEFIGFIGLGKVDFTAPFNESTPAVEIGWRLAFKHWGKGYATEGAKAALEYGFETLKLNEIVAFTVVKNVRSRHVMDKIGMHYDAKDDFDHPKVPENHPLKRHVLYRMSQQEWSLCQNVEHASGRFLPEAPT